MRIINHYQPIYNLRPESPRCKAGEVHETGLEPSWSDLTCMSEKNTIVSKQDHEEKFWLQERDLSGETIVVDEDDGYCD